MSRYIQTFVGSDIMIGDMEDGDLDLDLRLGVKRTTPWRKRLSHFRARQLLQRKWIPLERKVPSSECSKREDRQSEQMNIVGKCANCCDTNYTLLISVDANATQ